MKERLNKRCSLSSQRLANILNFLLVLILLVIIVGGVLVGSKIYAISEQGRINTDNRIEENFSGYYYGILPSLESSDLRTRQIDHSFKDLRPELQESDIEVEANGTIIRNYDSVDSGVIFTELGEYTITAYTAGYESTGKTPEHPAYGITASGSEVMEGMTIAADWRIIPPGTLLYIEDVGYRVVQDKGGDIKGYRLDLFMNDLQEALEWGVQSKAVWIVEGVD